MTWCVTNSSVGMSVNTETKFQIGSNPFKTFPVYPEDVAYKAILTAKRGYGGLSRESSNLSNTSVGEKLSSRGVRTQLVSNFALTVKESPKCYDISESLNPKTVVMPHLERERTFTTVSTSATTPRNFKFLRSNGSVKNPEPGEESFEQTSENRDDWKETIIKNHDARDVLYRNTYSYADRKLRYRSSVLPRIAQERPWTVGDPNNLKSRKTKVTKRRLDIFKSNSNSDVGGGFLNITGLSKSQEDSINQTNNMFQLRKIKTNPESNTKSQKSTVIEQPYEFGSHPEHMHYRRIERPLKYENVRYKPVSKTNKSSHIIRIPKALAQRDYKSADAYKEYLKTASQRRNRQSSAERQDSSYSEYGYVNRILQSVIDVNQPETALNEQGLDTNRFQDNKSIVIEIKTSWKNDPTVMNKNSTEPEAGRKCPRNSPVPMLHEK